jgi:hypothetical protein
MENQIDIQVVINQLTNQIAQLTAEVAVKNAVIASLQGEEPPPAEVTIVDNEVEDEA